MQKTEVREKLTRIYSGSSGLCLLLVLSLAIKGAVISHGGIVNRDGTLYIAVAKTFAAGDWGTALELFPMPLYPLALAGMHLIVSDWLLAGQLLSALSLSFALIPLYSLSREIFDSRAAFWAGLAFVLSPQINGYADELIRDPLYILFLCWTVWLSVRALQRGCRIGFLLVPIFALLAFLFRVEAIIVLPLWWGTLWTLVVLRQWERRRLIFGWLWSLVPLLAIAAVVLVVNGFDQTRLHRIGEIVLKGEMFLSGEFLASYFNIYEQLKGLEQSLPGWNQTQSFAEIARHFLWLIYLVGLLEYLVKDLYAPYLLLLLLPGIFLSSRRRDHWFLISLVIAHIMVAYLFHLQNNFITYRYLLAPVVLLYPFVGAGAERLRLRLAARRRRAPAMAVLLLLFVAIPLQKTFSDFAEKNMLEVAGRWLSAQPGLASQRWMTTDPRLPLYAGGDTRFILPDVPAADLESLEICALENEIDLIALERGAAARDVLTEMTNFEIIQRFEGKENEVIIYRRRE